MIVTDFSIPVSMRDGVKLSTIILKPERENSFPVFLLRTPYSAKKMLVAAKLVVQQFNSIVVLQDCRGRYDSEGVFRVCEEKEDTIDTIKWIDNQEWFNGELHIFGPSYLGYIGLQILDEEDIEIKTIFAPKVLGDVKYSIHRGDVLQYHWALPWAIMTSTRIQSPLDLINGTWPEAYKTAYESNIKDAVRNFGWPEQIWQFFLNPLDSPIWEQYDIRGSNPLQTRICLIGGWYDFLLNATLKTYEDLIKRGGIKPDLILGPWSHNGYLESQAGIETWDFGKVGKGNFIQDMSEFLEREKTNAEQIIKVFILRLNEWLELDSWPPNQVEHTVLYLSEDQLLSDSVSEEETVLQYEIDIDNPVPTLGGIVWESYKPIEPGPTDQSSLRNRDDILRFYTEPLKKDLTILGFSSVDIWIKTDVPETHLTAKLVVVESDGTQRIFQDGILRVLGPTTNYEKKSIDLLATGILLEKGEKLGLEISWSNFPKYALHPPSDKNTHSILLSKDSPSCLNLSVLTQE
ncbi:MAG: CocE/NonD family hydrolase [Candidatus Heimdallarchaeota archaeon]|nr:CocE/NonD family hydrolase [Candidatus Heimdallarchaeota archaeon]MCK4768813.1 CocE/NonD family hydrolase [Candidatus Heimdallarchaeota archaeon]